MIVKCTTTNFKSIPELVTCFSRYLKVESGELNLELKREYVVYGILLREDIPWYYLCTDEEDDPTLFPCCLFEVVCGKVSKYWYFGCQNGNICLSFSEWILEPMFYEYLVDGSPRENEIFRKYRLLMDRETKGIA